MGRWLDRIGMPEVGTGTPLEESCSVCERAIIDHPRWRRGGLGDGSAKWPHRRAVIAMLLGI
ncbi:hypothetical protein [Mycolicibacterium sphagni]|uniref:hypothetical protein n=1 Tax=Mycolicibacterium sphagni TaxID=1786 RepID=UPI0021F331C8|nr:hypothetical protein [Mycolicibacterium sphagni]MCV7174949.1 hypothetical protein [Mycolicibacterium sphagni]